MAARIPSMALYLVLLILSWKLCLVPVMARPLVNTLEKHPDVSRDATEGIFVRRSIMEDLRDTKHGIPRLLVTDRSGPSPPGEGNIH